MRYLLLFCFFAMLTMRVPQVQPSLTSPRVELGKVESSQSAAPEGVYVPWSFTPLKRPLLTQRMRGVQCQAQDVVAAL